MPLSRRLLAGVAWAALALPAAAQTGSIVNSTPSTLTRPNDANPYAQNDLIASSTTAGSVVVPSVAVGVPFSVPRVRLATNKTSGWDAATLRVRLWSAAPTYSGGDNAAYSVTTGAAGLLAIFDVTLSQFSDGASGQAAPSAGTAAWITATPVYWDLQDTTTAALTPAALQTFTLTLELAN